LYSIIFLFGQVWAGVGCEPAATGVATARVDWKKGVLPLLLSVLVGVLEQELCPHTPSFWQCDDLKRCLLNAVDETGARGPCRPLRPMQRGLKKMSRVPLGRSLAAPRGTRTERCPALFARRYPERFHCRISLRRSSLRSCQDPDEDARRELTNPCPSTLHSKCACCCSASLFVRCSRAR